MVCCNNKAEPPNYISRTEAEQGSANQDQLVFIFNLLLDFNRLTKCRVVIMQ